MVLKREVKKKLWNYVVSGIQDGLSMQRIHSLVAGGPYIPWSESALSATAVLTVLNDITVNRRSTIVECGGGVSSLFIGSLLSQQDHPGAHLYTIEHDEDWIEVLLEMLEAHRLDEWVTIISAPLSETSISWNGEPWYDTTVLESKFRGKEVDLLLVDGPPAHQSEIAYSRYPAAPFFNDMLGGRCCIVLDDIDREAEREIIQQWERELQISFQERLLKGNIAIGMRGQAYTV
jgi:hypothetical protein